MLLSHAQIKVQRPRMLKYGISIFQALEIPGKILKFDIRGTEESFK